MKIGQVLTIPVSSGNNPNTLFMYIVKKGDSLYSISKKYSTTPNEIKELNNLSNNTLYIGQTLKIPEMYTKEEDINMPSYKSYTVKKGDTIYSIAEDNNLEIDTILKDNGLTSNLINVGQILKIRLNKSQDDVQECFGRDYDEKNKEDELILYEVKKGDNLYNIAKKYNSTVSSIKSLNNLSSDNLSIGQILKLKANSLQKTYIVVKGDNLYSIARKFNTSVDDIKKKNNLSSNVLSIGQKLFI